MSKCTYCDDELFNNPFKYGYAKRVHAFGWLQPWRYYHKIAEVGGGGNFAGTYPVIWYRRVKCTKDTI